MYFQCLRINRKNEWRKQKKSWQAIIDSYIATHVYSLAGNFLPFSRPDIIACLRGEFYRFRQNFYVKMNEKKEKSYTNLPKEL